MMDLWSILWTVLGVLVPVALAGLGAVMKYGELRRQVRDQSDDAGELRKHIEKLEDRVERAEASAGETSRLAATIERAVEHLGEKFSGEVKRLGEIFELNYRHTNSRLDDIKAQLDRKVGE